MKWRGSSEQQVAPINRGRREGGRREEGGREEGGI